MFINDFNLTTTHCKVNEKVSVKRLGRGLINIIIGGYMNIQLQHEVLTGVENSLNLEGKILQYGIKHNIGNPYQWLADQLGYKSRNYLYRIFQNGNIGELKVRDLTLILSILGQDKETIINEVRKVINA